MKHKLLLILGLLILCASFVTAQTTTTTIPPQCACCFRPCTKGALTCVVTTEQICTEELYGEFHGDPCLDCDPGPCEEIVAPEFTTVSTVIAVIGVLAITYGVFQKKKKK